MPPPAPTAADLLLENAPSRYVVGIDLGTTNSAVCYVDTTERPWRARVLEIPQLVAPSQIESRDTLPSFHYQPLPAEAASGALQLPWHSGQENFVVGFMARDHGAAAPGRLVASAKSWLCHAGVDRTADLLPWHAADDVERISPVTVSSRYLAHLRAAWNHRFPNESLERQDVVLTLPASFDEIARELTVRAAAEAGLPRVLLIEEPQAAFYAWIYKHQENWEQQVSPGQKILVCDIGGGTTDFTLIRVRRGEQGKVQFHRVAVGDHLILGGDNMDLALAKHLESRLGGSLSPRQWDALLRHSRHVKEQCLADGGPTELTITLPGSGSKLIGSNLSTKITREEVQQLILEGFLPTVALTDRPLARRSGFQEFGLPYASDPAITRHLAAFLTTHRHAGDEERGAGEEREVDPARPDILLLNGGVFESTLLRERLIESLANWFPPSLKTENRKPKTLSAPPAPALLDNDRLDLAVARGAAYYGMVRRGEGVKIVASLARTYYIGLESDPPAALCLVPASAEPGQTVELAGRQFELLVSEPVEFPLYTSSVRLTDQPGQLVPFDPEQMLALPPIRTALRTRTRRERGVVQVTLHARLTEIGTLELWCQETAGQRTWKLQFDVRSATQTDIAPHESAAEIHGVVDEEVASACHAVLEETFVAASADPGSLIKRLTAAIGSDRQNWPPSLLRRLWEMLIELAAGRAKSPAHEARWLNLLGYALRPGYGLAVDDWRVAETWKIVQSKLSHAALTSRTESLILWRRIAGGLSSGQQRSLAEPLLAAVRALHRRHSANPGKAAEPTFSPHESLEVLRLLGSLELLPVAVKIDFGRLLLDLLPKKKLAQLAPALAWAIGRTGARQPVYGPLNTVLPPTEISAWATRLVTSDIEPTAAQFALIQLCRKTGDRFRDIDDPLREQVVTWLQARGASEHAQTLVREGGQLDVAEQTYVFGESLPKGLRLR